MEGNEQPNERTIEPMIALQGFGISGDANV